MISVMTRFGRDWFHIRLRFAGVFGTFEALTTPATVSVCGTPFGMAANVSVTVSLPALRVAFDTDSEGENAYFETVVAELLTTA